MDGHNVQSFLSVYYMGAVLPVVCLGKCVTSDLTEKSTIVRDKLNFSVR